MSAHPGPWKVCRTHEGFDGPYFEVEAGEQYPITRIESAAGTVAAAHDLFEFDEDDARLIAAAPKLLAQLQMAMVVLEGLNAKCTQDTAFILGCRAAIAEATGSAS